MAMLRMPRFTTLIYRLLLLSISMTFLLSTFLKDQTSLNNLYLQNVPTINNTVHVTTGNNIFYVNYTHGPWKKCEHPDYTFYLYSAYSYDKKEVVFIAGTRSKFDRKLLKLQCQFSSDNNELVNITTEAIVDFYYSLFIRCPLPENTKETGFEFVSILFGNQTSSPVRLLIQYVNLDSSFRQFGMSACVLPLYGYNEVFRFVEWLEFQKMMGVEHFTFYNLSIGPDTSCVMNNIDKWSNGRLSVKVHSWKGYPQKRDQDIRNQVGLPQAINECFYNHKGVSKYVVFADVDEFIVPEKDFITNYYELIDYLLSRQNNSKSKKIGEFRFRNAFYIKSREPDESLLERCAEFSENDEEYKVCKQLSTMMFDKRDDFRAWSSRTKYIAIPEGIKLAGNHFALKFEKGFGGMKVPEDIAFLRHYRYFKEEINITVESFPDTLGNRLVKGVAQSLQFFGKVCHLKDDKLFKFSLKF